LTGPHNWAMNGGMLDLGLAAMVLFACSAIGYPVTEWLPARLAWRASLAPVLGLAILAVIVPVAYRNGISLVWLYRATLVAAVALFALRARSIARAIAAIPPDERRSAILALAGYVAALFLLLAPRWSGGDQFAVFQGNQWDQFNYLQSAITYAKHPFETVVNADDELLRNNPLMAAAQTQLAHRPSVHMLYGMFSRLVHMQAYRLPYPFIVVCLSQFVLVALFVVRNLVPGGKPIAWVAVALVWPLGFWGQYSFDINAWSQVASAPVLVLLLALLLYSGAATTTRERTRLALVVGVVVAGCVYLYPEGLIIYLVAMPVVVARPVLHMIRARRFAFAPVIPFFGLAGLALAFLDPSLVEHLIGQVTAQSETKVDWWTYFQAFFSGRDGGDAGGIDFIAGLFGMYFATPPGDAPTTIAVLSRLAICVTVIGSIAAVIAVCSRRVRLHGELGSESRGLLISWSAIAIVLLLPAAYLAHDENYWPAGKVVSYAAPVFMTLLCVPSALSFGHRGLRPLRWIVVAFMVFQLSLAVVRIVAARDALGIHYAFPYPAASGLKETYGWDLAKLQPRIRKSMKVRLASMEAWPETYLMLFMEARGIRYAKTGTVNTYYYAGRDLGEQQVTWAPDVVISTEPGGFVLAHRNGPTVRLDARPRRR
jgi:hypothetical protein